ncbi:hypothetical protein NQZ68_038069 [Dissostichus eleginoides]|nr:hypothetical protein NQZ68_038069 [Dissostichus eleginoides]
MAADLQPEWISCLPSSWSYGVTRDGRVFFINEEAKSTTWLHPVSGEATYRLDGKKDILSRVRGALSSLFGALQRGLAHSHWLCGLAATIGLHSVSIEKQIVMT